MRSGSETLEKEFEKSDTLIVWCLLSSEKITTIIWKVFSFSTLHHFSFSKKKNSTSREIFDFEFQIFKIGLDAGNFSFFFERVQ